ncbi:hypothetical protein E4656_04570 [Natronospirillum operosum]|uniref:Sulfurtransferase complex subunit TusB n=1 Tax=Natronospirillum operosum TaxID=2759953 RepID=A0A4Z0WF98_9GAMM|nr:hypothetical protein [Natronospirillum operosum]TGG95690.1 hypothetical protein E4656_04570 [Natronospirillum operosum]
MNSTPAASGRLHLVLQARHWPNMLQLTTPGDRLILGGTALLQAALAADSLPELVQRHGISQCQVLAADCAALGLTMPADMAALDDLAWVEAIAVATGGVIQW